MTARAGTGHGWQRPGGGGRGCREPRRGRSALSARAAADVRRWGSRLPRRQPFREASASGSLFRRVLLCGGESHRYPECSRSVELCFRVMVERSHGGKQALELRPSGHVWSVLSKTTKTTEQEERVLALLMLEVRWGFEVKRRSQHKAQERAAVWLGSDEYSVTVWVQSVSLTRENYDKV